MRNRIHLASESKEDIPEVDVDLQMVESSMGKGEARNSDVIPPVELEGNGQESDIQELVERRREEETEATVVRQDTLEPHIPKANIAEEVSESAMAKAGGVSPQSRALPKTLHFLLYTVFISAVLWGLRVYFHGYQNSMAAVCSFHPLLCCGVQSPPGWSPWDDLLAMEDEVFDHLLKDMVAGYSLSMDVKDAQMKITDLRTFIRGTRRSQNDLLTNDLTGLIDEARKSGKNLQTFATSIGQSFERISSTNDWALQRIKRVRDTATNGVLRVLGLSQQNVETSFASDFKEAIDDLDKSLQVMINDAESNSNDLQRIDGDLKAIMRSIKGGWDDTLQAASALARHPSKVDEQRFERYLQGLTDLESYVERAKHVIGLAYSVLRDAKKKGETIRGRLGWELVAWSALTEKHVKTIAAGLESLEEKRVAAKSAQEEMLTRKVQ